LNDFSKCIGIASDFAKDITWEMSFVYQKSSDYRLLPISFELILKRGNWIIDEPLKYSKKNRSKLASMTDCEEFFFATGNNIQEG